MYVACSTGLRDMQNRTRRLPKVREGLDASMYSSHSMTLLSTRNFARLFLIECEEDDSRKWAQTPRTWRWTHAEERLESVEPMATRLLPQRPSDIRMERSASLPKWKKLRAPPFTLSSFLQHRPSSTFFPHLFSRLNRKRRQKLQRPGASAASDSRCGAPFDTVSFRFISPVKYYWVRNRLELVETQFEGTWNQTVAIGSETFGKRTFVFELRRRIIDIDID